MTVSPTQARRLARHIVADTALGRQLRGPIEEWGDACSAAQDKPNAENLSRLFNKARNLSNNLKDADISHSQSELLRSLYSEKE